MNYFAPKSNRGYRFTAMVMFVLFVCRGFGIANVNSGDGSEQMAAFIVRAFGL